LHREQKNTRSASLARQVIVTRFAACCVFAAFPSLFAADLPADSKAALDPLLKSVENRYNRTQSLTLSFSETYEGTGRPAQTESGILYLRKPGRMRWEYSSPPGKIFLSDGKEVFLYNPEDHRAKRSKLKESEDMRAPLAFLLGKLDFSKEFRTLGIRSVSAAGASETWIVAEPKSQNLLYTKVEFQALPSGEIRQVRVTGQDRSTLSFVFSGEQLNAPVSPNLFIFRAPPGVQVVEAER
jgi:outer membrane lipoprotein carrier protein